MSKAVRFFAYLSNIALFITTILFIMPTASSHDSEALITITLLLLLPILNIAALWNGPDLEERRLTRDLRKAQLRKKLEETEGKS